jgi:hypothetical protein
MWSPTFAKNAKDGAPGLYFETKTLVRRTFLGGAFLLELLKKTEIR